ncbi:MAG: ABC transporter ATP-binding protein [Patescibacteria group bacterium]
MPLLEVRNLEKNYKDGDTETPALRGVSFTIESGEFLAIMGPSGSGKSTLLHILGLLDKQSSGEYLFDKKGWDDYEEDEISHIRNKKMGFVFQAFNLLPRTTVFENVELPLLYSDVPESSWKKRTLDAIEAVGLSHRAYYESSQLSGGERQRVAIARALVRDPQIIFADEPTGNLDSKSGGVIMKILRELNESQNHTIVLITHETYTAEHTKRIIRLMDGKMVSDEPVQKRRSINDHNLK